MADLFLLRRGGGLFPTEMLVGGFFVSDQNEANPLDAVFQSGYI